VAGDRSAIPEALALEPQFGGFVQKCVDVTAWNSDAVAADKLHLVVVNPLSSDASAAAAGAWVCDRLAELGEDVSTKAARTCEDEALDATVRTQGETAVCIRARCTPFDFGFCL